MKILLYKETIWVLESDVLEIGNKGISIEKIFSLPLKRINLLFLNLGISNLNVNLLPLKPSQFTV